MYIIIIRQLIAITLCSCMFTAQDGYDYMGVSMEFIFEVGTSNRAVKCMDVAIIYSFSGDDEEHETFTVTLTTSSMIVALGNDVMTVTVIELFFSQYGNAILSLVKQ